MVTDYVESKILVAFKPEVKQSEIEKVLSKYPFKKVFDDLDISHSSDRDDLVLERLYSLTVNPGTEAAEMEGLKLKYGNLIEYAELLK